MKELVINSCGHIFWTLNYTDAETLYQELVRKVFGQDNVSDETLKQFADIVRAGVLSRYSSEITAYAKAELGYGGKKKSSKAKVQIG